MLNLVCRNFELEKSILADIQHVFPTLFRCKLDDDVNQLIFGLPASREHPVSFNEGGAVLPVVIKNNLKLLNDTLQSQSGDDRVPRLLHKLNNIEHVRDGSSIK